MKYVSTRRIGRWRPPLRTGGNRCILSVAPHLRNPMPPRPKRSNGAKPASFFTLTKVQRPGPLPLRLVAVLEQAHQLLERGRWLARRLERVANVLDRLHSDQRHVHTRRRAGELNRSLRIGGETAERIRDDRRQPER